MKNIIIAAVLAAILFSPLSASAKAKKSPAPKAPAAPAANAEPSLAASATFFWNQGAHFDSPYENWTLSGNLSDAEGKAWSINALFNRGGSVYMGVRNGFASLAPPGEAATNTAFFTQAILEAVLKTLNLKADVFPDSGDLRAAAETCRAGTCDGVDLLTDLADVYRTALYIRYGNNSLTRVSRNSFDYILNLDVRGSLIMLHLHSSKDPISLSEPSPLPVGTSGAAIAGYFFHDIKATGMLITADHKVKMLDGSMRFTHLWGAPDRQAFMKHSMVAQALDNGQFLYSFNFYNTGGTLLSSRVYSIAPDGKASIEKNFNLTETEQWTSPLSGVTYPTRWDLSGAGVEGSVSLDGKDHEISLFHGVGAFYLGPCSFVGTTKKENQILSGTGDCRLVNVEPVTR